MGHRLGARGQKIETLIRIKLAVRKRSCNSRASVCCAHHARCRLQDPMLEYSTRLLPLNSMQNSEVKTVLTGNLLEIGSTFLLGKRKMNCYKLCLVFFFLILIYY